MTLVLSPLYGSGFPRPSSLSLGCSVIVGSTGSSGSGGGGSTVIPNKLRSDVVALRSSLGPKTVLSKYSAVTSVASTKGFEGTLLVVVGSVLVRGSEEVNGSSIGSRMSVNNPGRLGAVLSVCWYFQRRLFVCLTLVLPTVVRSVRSCFAVW